jgi:hypothetical protein
VSKGLLFAYGSLVNPADAASTLAAEVEISPPVRLRGWRRRWSLVRDNHASEKTFARADSGEVPPFCVALSVEPAPRDPGPNGALLTLTQEQLERLDLREMRYDRIEVTDAIDGGEPTDLPVFVYTAKPRHHAPRPPAGAVILASYVRAVEEAFAQLGPEQLELFRATTEPPPVELVEGVLVRDRIPKGNPREW